VLHSHFSGPNRGHTITVVFAQTLRTLAAYKITADDFDAMVRVAASI
jgi:hypothetical protein